MRWAIVHRTEYRYATPAKDSFNEVRLQPMNTAEQTVQNFHLNVSPAAKLHYYRDFYANVVHHFEIVEPHANLTIESVVQACTRAPQALDPEAMVFPLERIGEAAHSLRCHDFVNPSTYVDMEPATWRLALDAIGGEADTWQAVQSISRFVHAHLKYVSRSTSVHTHMQEVLAQRQGVCQDFAHVTLGLCRAVKIPALYVSGYLATEAASATHAWVEAFLPEIGWRGFDPTHNCQIDESYLKIAVGRDYADVAPVSGHYKGTQQRQMDVNLQIRTDTGSD
jgi:transglutaminase-like putative cysteine protease